MGGFFWHLIHGYESYVNLPACVREQMSCNALRRITIGAIVPDLAKGEMKAKTHFYVNHPIYGNEYLIPDMKMAEKLFLKKNPTCLGVYSHLKYDLDHINRFLMVYAKPCGDKKYVNTKTGEIWDEMTLFGDWNEVYGQLYQFYDKFNSKMVREYVPKLNEVFETNFSANNEGFLTMMKWLFPVKMPMSGIAEMDKYRTTDDIHGILQGYFNDDGSNCYFNADIDEIMAIVHESAVEFSHQIEDLYESN